VYKNTKKEKEKEKGTGLSSGLGGAAVDLFLKVWC
jgi:hypothetical protein